MAGEDFLGNPVSGEPEALAAVDDFLAGFLAYEARAGGVIRAAADRPRHGLLNLYAAALYLLMESPEGAPRAAPFLELAKNADLNARERRTAAFVDAWIRGDTPAAEALGEQALGEWPRDLAMLKLCQYLAFNRGDFGRQLLASTQMPDFTEQGDADGLRLCQSRRLEGPERLVGLVVESDGDSSCHAVIVLHCVIQ